jgi:hypothetical protein
MMIRIRNVAVKGLRDVMIVGQAILRGVVTSLTLVIGDAMRIANPVNTVKTVRMERMEDMDALGLADPAESRERRETREIRDARESLERMESEGSEVLREPRV